MSRYLDIGTLEARERDLREQAKHVMKDLQAQGQGWEQAWKTHPIAIAYRALLREAWTQPIRWR